MIGLTPKCEKELLLKALGAEVIAVLLAEELTAVTAEGGGISGAGVGLIVVAKLAHGSDSSKRERVGRFLLFGFLFVFLKNYLY